MKHKAQATKKKQTWRMKLTISLIIVIGMSSILISGRNGMMKIVDDDIENISKLSSSIIHTEINNSLTGPIFVGQTMANDVFLKTWLDEEPKGEPDLMKERQMEKFLLEYSQEYNYSSVFVVSAKSNIYYGQNGINKIVTPANNHDVWYYDFIKSGKDYDLDVDIDEANNNLLTVFVNCRIENSSGELMGVAGVGIKMSHLQTLLNTYEAGYDLKAFLMDVNGVVQVDSELDNIEVTNFFADPEMLAIKDVITGNEDTMETFWYNSASNHCLITQYVKNLDWYLVIEKNTSAVESAFKAEIGQDTVIVTAIVVLVLFVVSLVLSRHNNDILQSANTDGVTGLPNSKMFLEKYIRNSKRASCKHGKFFMFDIDKFKDINDKYGHIVGNAVLARVSQEASDTIGEKGMVARWGGDEFVGVVYGPSDETEQILRQLVANVAEIDDAECDYITISLGAVELSDGTDVDEMINEADKIMYCVKDNGKNGAAFFNIAD